MGYEIKSKGSLDVMQFKAFGEYDFVLHGFSTRKGGVSIAPYESLNMGFKTGDQRQSVLENLVRFTKALEIDGKQVVFSEQVHEGTVRVVTGEDAGKGVTIPWECGGVDALITNQVGIPLMTYYADCVPLFFLDPQRRVVGLAHAGWPGTALKIGKKTVEQMMEVYGCHPGEIKVGIGPSIGPCCFEVSSDVIQKFNENFTQLERFVISRGQGKYLVDLWEANIIALEDIGVSRRNIEKSELCTCCREDLFFSYRRDQETGRMAAMIQLNPW